MRAALAVVLALALALPPGGAGAVSFTDSRGMTATSEQAMRDCIKITRDYYKLYPTLTTRDLKRIYFTCLHQKRVLM